METGAQLECDELLSKYKAFLVQMKQDHAVDFRDFTPDSRRLDTFLGNYMQDHSQFVKLWDIFKMFLTISHGKLPSSVGTLLTRICSLRTFTRRLLWPCVQFMTVSQRSKKRHVMSARM